MDQEKYPSDAAAKFMVRLPGDMRERLALAAKSNSRSMNSELVQRLQDSLDGTAGLRFPEETLDRLRKAAKKTGRTLEAEAWDRLMTSLADLPPAEARLREALDEARSANAKLQVESEEMRTEAWKRTTMLYILLDTAGYPISWAEIHQLLAGIKRAGNFNPSEMHTHIITPDMESSSRRAKEAATLAELFRAGGHSLITEVASERNSAAEAKSAARTRKRSPK
ncbi:MULTISPECIES: Arc family DNA-binding protein [unclassified Variovorax]|uniref:Arc family DNA-binding protein n=1 Tax=unclassified Variovorax TaxID=663243 RepID=UPI0034E86B22